MPSLNETIPITLNGLRSVITRQNGTHISMVNTPHSSEVGFISRVRTSVSTAGYPSVRNNVGLLPMNHFLFTKTEEYHSKLRYYEQRTWGSGGYEYITQDFTFSPSFGSPTVSEPGVDPAVMSKLRDRAVTKGLLKIKDQKVNLAQAFAERKQTADLIANSAMRIANALRSLRRGNVSKAARDLGVDIRKNIPPKSRRESTQRFMGRSWLELQYGWKPLLSDVYGAAEKLAQLETQKYLNRVVATAEDTSDSTSRIISGFETRDIVTRVKVKKKFVIYFVVPGDLSQVGSTLGLTNPALIAWELVPWSFVIDWFLPIGDYISTWDATLGVGFASGCETTIIDGSTILTNTLNYQAPDASYQIGQAESKKTRFTVERVPLNGFPFPAIPHFKNPLSVEHAANALALLNQLRK